MPREDFDLGTEPVLKIASPQRQYWRTTSYDRYDGRSIGVTDVAEHRHDAAEALADDPDGSGLRLSIEQKVTILAPSAVALFAADAPRSFSVAVLADERQVGWDLAAVRAATPLQRGQSYSVTSLVAMAEPPRAGRGAGGVSALDRAVPRAAVALPTRVGELTNQVTASARNPLERALAIEDVSAA